MLQKGAAKTRRSQSGPRRTAYTARTENDRKTMNQILEHVQKLDQMSEDLNEIKEQVTKKRRKKRFSLFSKKKHKKHEHQGNDSVPKKETQRKQKQKRDITDLLKDPGVKELLQKSGKNGSVSDLANDGDFSKFANQLMSDPAVRSLLKENSHLLKNGGNLSEVMKLAQNPLIKSMLQGMK